jgi:hypothetical protein
MRDASVVGKKVGTSKAKAATAAVSSDISSDSFSSDDDGENNNNGAKEKRVKSQGRNSELNLSPLIKLNIYKFARV